MYLMSWKRPLLDSSIEDLKDGNADTQPHSEGDASSKSDDVPLINITYLDSSNDVYTDVYVPGTIVHKSQVSCDQIAIMFVLFMLVILICILWFIVIAT